MDTIVSELTNLRTLTHSMCSCNSSHAAYLFLPGKKHRYLL